jgi:hypothetical protein
LEGSSAHLEKEGLWRIEQAETFLQRIANWFKIKEKYYIGATPSQIFFHGMARVFSGIENNVGDCTKLWNVANPLKASTNTE